MDTVADRLKWARAKAGYTGPTEAAEAFGFNYSNYSGHENGGRVPGKINAARYARAFKVRLEWLVYGQGEPIEIGKPSGRVVSVPLVSWVSAGQLSLGETVMDDAVLRHVDVADLPSGDWAALEVDGDSMDRIAPHGSMIVVNRREQVLKSEKFYVISTETGETTFKRYRSSPDRLQPFSTNPDHETIMLNGSEHVFGRLKRVIIDVG